jgi:D-alanyl-D-alanine carboxypeptidase/D-alanyl-D-alanine-endopeptidase (penicillin-binding protein 4)
MRWRLAFLTWLVPALSIAQTPSDRIEAVLALPALRHATIAVYARVPGEAPLVERMPDVRLIPASGQKILTALYALSRLDVASRPLTRIWKTDSGIIVDAPGDPSMTSSRLVDARQRLGAKGRVWVRQAYAPGVPPGWEHDDLAYRYAPRIHSLTVDRGTFDVVVERGRIALPAACGVRLTRGASSGAVRLRFDPFERSLSVSGRLPEPRATLGAFPLPDPAACAAELLGGSLVFASGVPDRAPDLVLAGEPIGDAVRAALESSDNHAAEHLLLMTASAEGALPRQDPYPLARARLNSFLAECLGSSSASFLPGDGSGLSRHNGLTARGMVDLLDWARSRPLFPTFRSMLPVPGRGTLHDRLPGVAVAAKTGALSGVASLCGYLVTEDDRDVTFAILINGASAGGPALRDAIDAIVAILASPIPSGTHLASPGW